MSEEFDPFAKGKERKKKEAPKPKKKQKYIGVTVPYQHNIADFDKILHHLEGIKTRDKRITDSHAGRVAFEFLARAIERGSAKDLRDIKDMMSRNW